MVWIKTKCTWSSHWDSRHMTNNHVYKLKKALYRLKQVPRTWYGRFDGVLIGLDFTKGKVDYNLCDKIDDGDDPIHRMWMDTGDS